MIKIQNRRCEDAVPLPINSSVVGQEHPCSAVRRGQPKNHLSSYKDSKKFMIQGMKMYNKFNRQGLRWKIWASRRNPPMRRFIAAYVVLLLLRIA